NMDSPKFHIAMYPWFALGHITPFLHLSNKLAKKGHRISFFIPTKTQSKLEAFNLHPDLITFVPITVPHVDGLPPGAETTHDVPFPLQTLLMTAMDRTQNDIENLLHRLKVDVVFFDFTHWMPAVARQLGIKSVHYCIISTATIGYTLSPAWKLLGREVTADDLIRPPTCYPNSSIKLYPHKARVFATMWFMKFDENTQFGKRNFINLNHCDTIGFKTCREIEGPYCDYLAT
ncbi:Cyanidin 3-O-galactoside 2''-O-xylosyltransferase FGGT1, partial [Sarracenia purpurea var. burkii]